jgi:hypothetical protein
MNMNDHGGNSRNIYRFKNIWSCVLNNVPHSNESFRNIHIILHQVWTLMITVVKTKIYLDSKTLDHLYLTI